MSKLRLGLALLLGVLFVTAGCEEGGTWLVDDDDAGDDDDDDVGDDDSGDDDSGDDDTDPPADEVYLWPPLDFGDVLLGCDDVLAMEVVNDTAVEVVVIDLTFVADTDEAALGSASPPPWTIPAGEAVAFDVSYHPQLVAPFDLPVEAITDHPDFGSVVQDVAGNGEPDHDWMDGFVAPEASLVDILWVVDNSCSMQEHQLALADMAAAFIGFLLGEGIEYHVGVVTTDNGLLQGNTAIIDAATPNAAAVFAANVAVGIGGSGQEQPLRYALEAVTPPLHAPGGPNDGFVREPAGLAVILLTDEPDQSPQPVSHYVTELMALKGDADRLAISAVYNADTVCTNGWEQAPRIDQAIADTGGAGVCIWEEDWMPVLSTIPAMVMAPLDRFKLTFVPMPATIEVTVDGTVSWNWTYDEPSNSVVFDPGAIPLPGDEILVYYVEPAGSC